VPITWYLTSPYDTPEGTGRWSWYGGPGTPAAFFDGYDDIIGGQESGSMYSTYQPIVGAHLGDESPLIVEAFYTLIGLEGALSVTIEVDQAVTTTNNVVQFAVFENNIIGEVNLARDVLAPEPFTLTTPGQSVVLNRAFTVSPSWAVENLGVAVFVQSEAGDKRVLQAALAVPDYAGLIHVDANPEGLDAPWTLAGPDGFVQERINDASLPVFSAGEYTITWGAVEGWTTPVPALETLTLVEDGELLFTGLYTGGPFVGESGGDLGNASGADQGVALRDWDGDGDLDIAVACRGTADLLLSNQSGNAFSAVPSPLLAGTAASTSIAWGDFDDDGHPDLYIARDGEANALLRNDGAGGFVDVTFSDAGDTGPASTAIWTDFNRDGNLDLYVVNTGQMDRYLMNLGLVGGNYLFFTYGSGNEGSGVAAAWADYDDDGDQDFYLTRSFAANVLYQYDGVSPFGEATVPTVLSDVGGGAGCAWGDYDNDGDLDLYFANDGSRDRLVRQTTTSWSLVLGGALEDPGHGRGVAWGDLDNDGDLDLYIARHGEYDRFLRNDGGVFVNVPLGIDATAGLANGVALGDTDGDGDLDVYVGNESGPNVLLINQLDNGNHWLHVDLVGDDCNRDAVGARVRLVAGSLSLMREVNGGSGFRSQDSPTVEFGLGAAATADSVIVRWPCGGEEVFTDLAADQKLTVVENGTTAVQPPQTPAPELRLMPARPNPFNPRTEVVFDLPYGGRAHLAVYDVCGRLVRTLSTGELPAGRNRVVWSGDDDAGRPVATGTYLLRLRQGGHAAVRRVTLMK